MCFPLEFLIGLHKLERTMDETVEPGEPWRKLWLLSCVACFGDSCLEKKNFRNGTFWRVQSGVATPLIENFALMEHTKSRVTWPVASAGRRSRDSHGVRDQLIDVPYWFAIPASVRRAQRRTKRDERFFRLA